MKESNLNTEKILEKVKPLLELADMDDSNPNTLIIDNVRFTGAILRHNKLVCIQCHKSLSKLEELIHMLTADYRDKSIYQCSCGQYVIKTYTSKL